MRTGHHGYQPAGGGGDGVLAVTSSSLSEIKVWLTHTPTYHWTPFPAVDQTQHAFAQSNMNFKFTMNPLTNKRWNAGNVYMCFWQEWDERHVTMLQLCIRVWGWSAIKDRSNMYAMQAMATHVDGRKCGYILASVKPMSIILQYTKKLLQKIHFVAAGTDLIFSNLSVLKYLKKPHN